MNQLTSDATTPGRREAFLGSGVLTWSMSERTSGRYGTVFLLNSDGSADDPLPLDDKSVRRVCGLVGWLTATVTEVRPSQRIFDAPRNLRPTAPVLGERIVLGRGTAFCEIHPETGVSIGTVPSCPASEELLVPAMVYRAHGHLVALTFVLNPE